MPRHADALYNLGVACAEDGQTERALFCYELTTHFNPNCAEAWNNLGVLHKEADNLERAAECYMAALNIRPNFPQVRAACVSSCNVAHGVCTPSPAQAVAAGSRPGTGLLLLDCLAGHIAWPLRHACV